MKHWIAVSAAPAVIIDHYAERSATESLTTLQLIDEKATSTCEIVFKLYKRFGVKPPNDIAECLLTGLAYDGWRFSLGTHRTFEAASEILDEDGSLSDMYSLRGQYMSTSEKIAGMKDGQRMKFQRLGDRIIVVTRVGCYQASVARGLLDHGVEVPVVAGHEKNEVRVNTRATGQLVRNSSLHLGEDAAMPLARAFGGFRRRTFHFSGSEYLR